MHDIEFTSDGTKMFVVGRDSDKVHQYTLSTAWDVTTASYSNVFLDVSSQGLQPNGMHLKADDGTKLYVVDSQTNAVYQYSTGASQNFSQPTSQYHVAVTNSGGQIDSQYFTDINSMTAAESAGTGTAHYAVSTDGRTTWSVAKGTDGVRPIVRNNSGTWQYNNESSTTTTGWNLAGIANDNKNFNVGRSCNDVTFSPDGTKVQYIENNGLIYQRTLSTAWDISTAASSEQFFNQSSQDADPRDLVWGDSGTKAYLVGDQNNVIYQYDCSVAYDIPYLSYANKSYGVASRHTSPYSMAWKPDGTKYYTFGYNGSTVSQYTCSTAWDISTSSFTSGMNPFAGIGNEGALADIHIKPDGTKLYIVGSDEDKIFEYTFGTAWDISTLSYSGNSYAIGSIGGATLATVARALYFKPDGTKVYIIDFSQQKVFQYSTSLAVNNYQTAATWTNGTVNDELYTLQQALSVESNRMDKTQLDAVADANHFSTGSSLDLMIALRMDTAANTLPTSDGVTLNYDAAALNEGAVLGTDYDFFHPAANKVQIKSLAAQNLKVRVV